ncbi:MAG: hypothetical protein EHM70_11905 [Chloroflexota bacterium]|nr:MAG: hypothetical protein EHM70_11905 [Chloroflexota bacterium]
MFSGTKKYIGATVRDIFSHRKLYMSWVKQWLLAGSIVVMGVFSSSSTGVWANSYPISGSVVYLPLLVSDRDSPANPFGVETDGTSDADGWPFVLDAGVAWTRLSWNSVIWSSVEPEEGLRNWDTLQYLDNQLIAAAENDIQVILVVRSTPEWAQKIPGYSCGPIHPDHLDAFARFMFDLVARYSQPPYRVKYWELWNEPDVSASVIPSPTNAWGCWGDETDPYYGGGYYGEMLAEVYPAVKAANGHAQLITGGLLLDCDPDLNPGLCLPARFFEGILKSNGGNSFDGVAFHAYDHYLGQLGAYASPGWNSAWNSTGPSLISKAKYLHNLLEAYSIQGKFMMNTETGLLCDVCNDDDAFESTKAAYIAQSYAAALANGLSANIWYSLLGWRGTALISSGGIPLPAYEALVFARQTLVGAEIKREIVTYPGVMGYEFAIKDRTLWLVWSLDGQRHTIELPQLPTSVHDIYGGAAVVSDTIDLEIDPVYIIWDP